MTTYYGKKYKMLELRHRAKEILLSVRIASKSKERGKPAMEKPACIAMVDGNAFHGGMCDRFKGIISLYAYCKYRGIPFRIRYTYPFKLEDYLQPAAYDWTLKKGEYTDNPIYARVLYMRGEHFATRLLDLKMKKQVHFYSNRDLLNHVNEAYTKEKGSNAPFDWGDLFCELFKPGKELQSRMNAIKKSIGGDYYAAVFRFQNLLGDFHEYHFKALNDKEKEEKLITTCLDAIKKLMAEHCNRPLLVTADSTTFLKRAAQIDGVHIIPGTLIHMDGQKHYDTANQHETYLKSFLDFYMLSGAQKIYRIGTKQMYRSQFPVYAAKVHGIPFESIEI